MSAMKNLLEDLVCKASKMSGIDDGVLMNSYGIMAEKDMFDNTVDNDEFERSLVRFTLTGKVSKPVYVVYEDFIMNKAIRACRTHREAQALRKQFPSHSEVWIEKI